MDGNIIYDPQRVKGNSLEGVMLELSTLGQPKVNGLGRSPVLQNV